MPYFSEISLASTPSKIYFKYQVPALLPLLSQQQCIFDNFHDAFELFIAFLFGYDHGLIGFVCKV